ncbi:type II secretion system F family protein [Paenibacillus chungangensis]|uniref:Type II secretion system F family protein n=1 Tax=Paenibacillus chungangensis TaxID=696535 RepID=A0ABW3HUN2_9BACL
MQRAELLKKKRLNRLLRWSGWDSLLEKKSQRRGDQPLSYCSYRLAERELLLSIIFGGTLLFFGAYLFYQSVAVAIFASLGGLLAPRYRRAAMLERRRNMLKLQFKEALYALASSLAAGRSLEVAFRTTLEDLRLLYPDASTFILLEFQRICHLLDSGEPLERGLKSLAVRAGIEEIVDFSEAVSTCKRSGGDMLVVMRRTSSIIGEKLGVESEIKVLIAQKRFEARIMMAVPFVFMLFLSLAAPDYMKPLYSSPGYVLLTAALLILALCFWMMHRMMSITL